MHTHERRKDNLRSCVIFSTKQLPHQASHYRGGHSLEEKIQRLSTSFSGPIPAKFYVVTEYLMKAILGSI